MISVLKGSLRNHYGRRWWWLITLTSMPANPPLKQIWVSLWPPTFYKFKKSKVHNNALFNVLCTLILEHMSIKILAKYGYPPPQIWIDLCAYPWKSPSPLIIFEQSLGSCTRCRVWANWILCTTIVHMLLVYIVYNM